MLHTRLLSYTAAIGPETKDPDIEGLSGIVVVNPAEPVGLSGIYVGEA